jgi:hypothetical protein
VKSVKSQHRHNKCGKPSETDEVGEQEPVGPFGQREGCVSDHGSWVRRGSLYPNHETARPLADARVWGVVRVPSLRGSPIAEDGTPETRPSLPALSQLNLNGPVTIGSPLGAGLDRKVMS